MEHKKPAEEVERRWIKYRQSSQVGDGGTQRAPDCPRGLLREGAQGLRKNLFWETEE